MASPRLKRELENRQKYEELIKNKYQILEPKPNKNLTDY